ncbi:ribonuclease H-like domain-containing protein [Candidatus Woesearchaeota archaeon]|nr:ribonuclease H-like domain-containing protein [Candidatus Woesearchaeota archaeon]MBT4111339.1 ribonuclease H-like domain-containing protein [Candidatus Woesearchaeota archaeon]MBT4336482.1 ribonuclease H-like domain-containing protein [Candidatus Woesearchaeota archaeon]MBT4469895.1 ribonuclease H-like domain-containing protein [Candidatus Woesearchaeota archaeon]MBT6744434.1 ribonuclease H-like domain-containing protein [Candidatus Woesearchaeota archaeon]
MLTNSFIHIPGISKEKEVMLWSSNILNWQEFLDNDTFPSMRSWIEESVEAHQNNNHKFFLTHLPGNEHWRVYKQFNCCFLDIETTGLSKHYHDVTVIGLYDGKESKIFINGKNMDQFPAEMAKYSTIISFNGKCFDVPFLKAKFPEIDFNKFHIDLRYVMKSIGYSGGLKKIEKEVGICRDDDLQDISGFDAIRLWRQYQRGDEEALKLLVKYNIADIENLKTLMDFTYDKLRDKHFLGKIE